MEHLHHPVGQGEAPARILCCRRPFIVLLFSLLCPLALFWLCSGVCVREAAEKDEGDNGLAIGDAFVKTTTIQPALLATSIAHTQVKQHTHINTNTNQMLRSALLRTQFCVARALAQPYERGGRPLRPTRDPSSISPRL